MFHLWLVIRFVTSGRRLLNLPSVMALAGMALGVASLTVAMGVVSGYENTLKQAIVDVFGHLIVVKRGEKTQNVESIVSSIKEAAPEAMTYTPFVNIEGMIVGGGKLSGVQLQGMEPKSMEKVLEIRKRVIRGELDLRPRDGVPAALVGKSLARRFDLKLGEPFKVVVPAPNRSDSAGLTPRVQNFVLVGVLDLGKAEYDERTVVTDLAAAQAFANIGEAFTGIRIRLKDSDKASEVSSRIARKLGAGYWTMDWAEVNRNLFEAIKIEKVAIFFVILVMVIAASFNIASNLFVSVLQKYANISILRAMGFSSRDVASVFVLQGLFFGVMGTLIGLALGLLLSLVFVFAQRYVVLLPVEAYKLDHVGVVLRPWDLVAIIGASVLVCLVSTLVPAIRGAKLDPVEGLRYE